MLCFCCKPKGVERNFLTAEGQRILLQQMRAMAKSNRSPGTEKCPVAPANHREGKTDMSSQAPKDQLQQVSSRVKQILTAGEEILHIAIENDPLNPIANLSPDAIVLTNRRFIIYRPKLLGGASFEDYIWRDLRDARLKEGMTRATLTFKTVKGQAIAIQNLQKAEARRLYAIAQEQEEKMLEERRQRAIEEKRAAAGGVILHGAQVPVAGAPAAAPAPPQEDPVQVLQKLKTMLEADLISQEEYDAKKAEILSRM